MGTNDERENGAKPGVVIFQLTHNTHDCRTDYNFVPPEGATPAQFKELCDTLMREAARELMAEIEADPEIQNQGWSVGYEELVEMVARKLPEFGYVRPGVCKVQYLHGLILRDDDERQCGDAVKVLGPDLAQQVFEFNRKQWGRIYE